MKKLFFILFLLLMATLVIINKDLFQKPQVCFEEHCFNVEHARTLTERKEGLMFREKLDQNEGMLFVFPEEKKASLWMKNMLIPLDMIWISQDKEVIFISKDNQPCSSEQCFSINPGVKAKYVLELNAGTADKIDLEIGDKLIFEEE